jgi:hypothetical protein
MANRFLLCRHFENDVKDRKVQEAKNAKIRQKPAAIVVLKPQIAQDK